MVFLTAEPTAPRQDIARFVFTMGFSGLPLELRLDILNRWQRNTRREYILRSTHRLLSAAATHTSVTLAGHPTSKEVILDCTGRVACVVRVDSVTPNDGAAATFMVISSGNIIMRLTSGSGGSGETLNVVMNSPFPALCWDRPPQDSASGPYVFRIKVL